MPLMKDKMPFLVLYRVWEAGLAHGAASKREWLRDALQAAEVGEPVAFLYPNCTCERGPELHFYDERYDCPAVWVGFDDWVREMFS